MGKQRETMVNTFAGLAAKIVISTICGLFFGVAGFILGSTACFLAVTLLNLRLIRKDVQLQVLGKKWTSYIIAIAVSAGVSILVHYGILELTTGLSDKLSYLITVIVTGSILCLLYGILLLKLHIVTTDDVESLPGKLRGPMKKVMRVLRAG